MNKKEMKTLRDLAATLERTDGIVMVLLCSAGIGRMGFKAAFAADGEIDRQDGEDDGTYETPGDALRAMADELDRKLVKEAWDARLDALRGDR